MCAAAQSQANKALLLEGVGLGDTSDALNPFPQEMRLFIITAPLNWIYHRLAEVFASSEREPSGKELLLQIPPRPVLYIAAGNDEFEPSMAKRYAQ